MHTNTANVECLESRNLMSAAFMAGGMLTVMGNPGDSNTITVNYTDESKAMIEVKVTSVGRGAVKSLDKTFDATKVGSLFVKGGIKADSISVGQDDVGFDKPTRVWAMAGADTINTGAENDTILGAAGADTIFSGNGDDKVDGGLGNDVIVVGNDNDVVVGGAGNDTLTAHDQAGKGVHVFAGLGNDTVTVGDGNDSVWGGAGDDIVTAGNGDDAFGCYLGKNTVTAGTGHNTYYVGKNTSNTTSYDSSKDTLVTTGKKEQDLATVSAKR